MVSFSSNNFGMPKFAMANKAATHTKAPHFGMSILAPGVVIKSSANDEERKAAEDALEAILREDQIIQLVTSPRTGDTHALIADNLGDDARTKLEALSKQLNKRMGELSAALSGTQNANAIKGLQEDIQEAAAQYAADVRELIPASLRDALGLDPLPVVAEPEKKPRRRLILRA